MVIEGIYRRRKDRAMITLPMSLTKINLETGKQTLVCDAIRELRRPKGASVHAPERYFAVSKPRYRLCGGLLVMESRKA
jgi:hypothetical protein